MYDVNKVFENSNLSAQEQFIFLTHAEKNIANLKSALMEKCRHCKTCDKYYFKTELNIDARKVKKTVCTNPLTGGYLDPYEYEECEVAEFCYKCPEGHQIGEYKEWLSSL